MNCRKIIIKTCFLYLVFGIYFNLDSENFRAKIEHKVQKGDTLSQLSYQYYGKGTKNYWSKLHKVNPQIQNPHLIYPGNFINLIPQYHRYINMQIGYAINTSSTKTNTFTIRQTRIFPPSFLNLKNNKSDPGIDISFQIGYRWYISSHYSYSLGAAVFETPALMQSGYSQFRGSSARNNYHYYYSNTALVTSNSFIYFNKGWQYSLSLYLGLATIDSFGYQNKTLGDTFFSNRTTQPAYGGAISIMKFITRNISMGVNLVYLNTGKSLMGKREFWPPSLEPIGKLQQPTRMLLSNLSITYWF